MYIPPALTEIVERIWKKDHTLWKPDPRELANRLGWLTSPAWMQDKLSDLLAFVENAREFDDVVLLGMGGSSLAPDVLRAAFGNQPGYPRLHILDLTSAAHVENLTNRLDIAKTLFIVSSKSGGTVELISFFKHFWQLVSEQSDQNPGNHFIAITDPGSPLENRANEQGFRRIFLNPPDIGGRFSAISYFGLAPAALAGYDITGLGDSALHMQQRCQAPASENPGALLGQWLGLHAQHGRDKLTFLTSPRLATFGLWAEQLIAESTGKEGKGILPIATEPLLPLNHYSTDRVFAYLRLAGDDNATVDSHYQALLQADKPILRFDLLSPTDLGGELYRWEFATAVAGAMFGIQPFDQPNVQESKNITQEVLANPPQPLETTGTWEDLLQQARSGDYLALLVYAAETPELTQALQELRAEISSATHLPTTLGYGPRYLHSTGQFHKGGPNSGLFVQLILPSPRDLPIPDSPFTFDELAMAQAAGDYQALSNHHRRVIRVLLESEVGANGRSPLQGGI